MCISNKQDQMQMPETLVALWRVILVFSLALCSDAGQVQTCEARSKGEMQKLKVVDIKKSQVDHPTGDPKFSVLEAFPSPFKRVEEVDPFLICHEWGKSTKQMGVAAIDPGKPKEKQKKHVGWHPHRGFDIVSYVKEGRGSHADSMGNVAIVKPGGIQWMRTASGVEHAEGGGNPKNANKHGFQLWINLPSKLKMATPGYGTVQPEDIPEKTSASGVKTRYIAGWKSAAFLDRSDAFTIIDVEMPTNTQHVVHLPENLLETILVYAYRGETGTVNKKHVSSAHIARLVIGDRLSGSDTKLPECNSDATLSDSNYGVIELETKADEYGVIIFAGKRINESVAWRGPIVMNTWEEIDTAYKELRRGTFLKTRVNYDYHI